MFFTVFSQSSHIRNIKLKRPISARSIIGDTDTTIFQSDLALAYSSFGHHASLINKSCKFYEYATYIQDVDYAETKCKLHKNDVVMIQVEDFDKSYAVIKAIFKHKGNDEQYYPFIYVDWFEDIHQNHDKLDCPLFFLCHNNTWRKIFPLPVVGEIQKTHFVHFCTAQCEKNSHDPNNNQYLKNDFFFKAI
jgi:hypothetical protein